LARPSATEDGTQAARTRLNAELANVEGGFTASRKRQVPATLVVSANPVNEV
jgi:hypothetical protein